MAEKEQRIRELMEAFGLQRHEAELAYAIEVGDLTGDIIEVEDERELDDTGSSDEEE